MADKIIIQFLVTCEIKCADPDSFKPGEFAKKDGNDMTPYLKEKIFDCLNGSFQYAAKVGKVSVTNRIKFHNIIDPSF